MSISRVSGIMGKQFMGIMVSYMYLLYAKYYARYYRKKEYRAPSFKEFAH